MMAFHVSQNLRISIPAHEELLMLDKSVYPAFPCLAICFEHFRCERSSLRIVICHVSRTFSRSVMTHVDR